MSVSLLITDSLIYFYFSCCSTILFVDEDFEAYLLACPCPLLVEFFLLK